MPGMPGMPVEAAATFLRENDARFTVNASLYAVPADEAMGFACTGPLACLNGVTFQPMAYQQA